jgi:hypothetical protein
LGLENGASSNPCDETYAGAQPLSEVENRNLRDFAIKYQSRIKLYLTFHTYGEVSICTAVIQGGAKVKICVLLILDGAKFKCVCVCVCVYVCVCASLHRIMQKLSMCASVIQGGANHLTLDG